MCAASDRVDPVGILVVEIDRRAVRPSIAFRVSRTAEPTSYRKYLPLVVFAATHYARKSRLHNRCSRVKKVNSSEIGLRRRRPAKRSDGRDFGLSAIINGARDGAPPRMGPHSRLNTLAIRFRDSQSPGHRLLLCAQSERPRRRGGLFAGSVH